MYEFVYCFTINNRVEWSSETANSLSRWLKDEKEIEKVTDFIESSEPGNFICLNNGALLFRCAAPIKPQHTNPRPLGDVLEDAGLLNNETTLNL
jgi:hypothetical protein